MYSKCFEKNDSDFIFLGIRLQLYTEKKTRSIQIWCKKKEYSSAVTIFQGSGFSFDDMKEPDLSYNMIKNPQEHSKNYNRGKYFDSLSINVIVGHSTQGKNIMR